MAGAASFASRSVISVLGALVGLTSTATRNSLWYQLLQEHQPPVHLLLDEKIDAGRVASRPGEAGNET